ncbi:MAG: hypothetical protein GY847_42085 [Proteobacteria bacterium]|nr:hypothetical protein [Pseudomonadota bacterium]
MKSYSNGAFVFTRSRGLTPKTPEEIQPIALKHGIDPQVIPEYAGDRAAVGRAIARTDTKIAGDTYLLRPIRRNSKEVIYGIVREDKHSDDHLDHAHEATVTWKSEPDSGVIEGNHTIANRVRGLYQDLRGKIVSEDWTAAVTAQLDTLGAVPFREDGRVYWVPPQSLDDVKRLREFLSEVGVSLVVAEVESESTGVVTEVVAENVDEQLLRLEKEVEDFSDTQKPSMFARRLEEFQKLKQKALLYESALGIASNRTTKVLTDLEQKVQAMLDIRSNTVVHKDGRVSKKGERVPASRSSDVNPVGDVNDTRGVDNAIAPENPTMSKTQGSSLTFAGTKFVSGERRSKKELLFTSSDDKAVGAVRSLESMGLAGKWQKTSGDIQVSIQNSGPKGAETSIRLRLGDVALDEAGTALRGLGIEMEESCRVK